MTEGIYDITPRLPKKDKATTEQQIWHYIPAEEDN